MTIGACLIVKNESKLLPRCLESIKGLDAIFISDTGSEDNTVEIAKKYTPHVYTEDLWHDSFADARNFIRKKATTDWILSIDADEYCHDVEKVREAVALAEQKGLKAVDVKMIAEAKTKEGKEQSFYFPRLFKNLPDVFWDRNIHNILSITGEQIGDVRITHGYSPAHDLDPERAFRILQKDVAENGGNRERFYLGREYYYRGDYESAILLLQEYVKKSRYLAEKAEAFLIMARCLWGTGRGDEAREAIANALIINANFKEAILFMADMSFEHNAVQWRKMAETANNRDVLFIRNP